MTFWCCFLVPFNHCLRWPKASARMCCQCVQQVGVGSASANSENTRLKTKSSEPWCSDSWRNKELIHMMGLILLSVRGCSDMSSVLHWVRHTGNAIPLLQLIRETALLHPWFTSKEHAWTVITCPFYEVVWVRCSSRLKKPRKSELTAPDAWSLAIQFSVESPFYRKFKSLSLSGNATRRSYPPFYSLEITYWVNRRGKLYVSTIRPIEPWSALLTGHCLHVVVSPITVFQVEYIDHPH